MTGCRVLLVDPSERGGIAVYTDALAAALAATGGSVTLLTSSTRPAAAVPTLRALPSQRWGRDPEQPALLFYLGRLRTAWLTRRAVLRAIATVQPDVVHLQAEIVRRLDHLLVADIRRRVPVVVTAHDVQPLSAEPPRLAWLRAADAVVVHTEPARLLLADHRIPSVVVEHIPATVPPEAGPDAPRSGARHELGLPETGRLVAALGFVRQYKGYALLADVWEQLGPQAPLLLVLGEAWDEEASQVLDRLEATGRAVVRRGFATDRELALAARAADALLLPYERASDSGLVHLARATGTPVLASDAPQLAASVRATGSGAVVARDVTAWSAAVTGALPPAPAAPPAAEQIARAHLTVYDLARRRRLLACTDATEWGGAEVVLSRVVEHLAADWDVTVLGTDHTITARVAAGAPEAATVVLPPVAGKRDLIGIVRHVRAVRQAAPDVLLVNLRIPWAGQYTTLAGLLLRVPVVAVEHFPDTTESGLQVRLKRWAVSRLAAHLAVSDAAAGRVEQLVGLPTGSVRTLRNGVPRLAVTPGELPAALPHPCVVAAGRLDPIKGFDVLLQAMALVPGVSLWLLGDGPERPVLEALCDQLGLRDRVRFAGWYDDVAGAFAAADLVVLPSHYEAAPLVATEALQVGTPLVATAVGGIPELVGDAAALVPPDDPRRLADAIRDVLADPDRQRQLCAAGRARAAGWPTPADMARDYDAVLRSVLRRH
ncbi:MAG: glycosyltransferase [Frankiaceae bacterium]|nr:glycosyltransferase [Frankiaceae bacterium]